MSERKTGRALRRTSAVVAVSVALAGSVMVPACTQDDAPDAAADVIEAFRGELRRRAAARAAEVRTEAEAGDAEAQNGLGLLYARGLGVAQDHAEAAEWYRRAAEQGHAGAQFSLGVAYWFGNGVAQDYADRSRIARQMSREAIQEAQRLAREWQPE